MPYKFVIDDDQQRMEIRSALYDALYEFESQMKRAIEKGEYWDARWAATRLVRIERALQYLAYDCKWPNFTDEEKGLLEEVRTAEDMAQQIAEEQKEQATLEQELDANPTGWLEQQGEAI